MSDITPLLLDAKKEYTSRLEEIVTPQLRATFGALYAACVDDGGSDVYVCFQGKMREIPFWNSSIVQQKTQQLISSYSFFENLVVAVIVTYVKVLSAIRLGEGRPSVKLKVPRTDEFVHEIYKQMAQICYYEPFVVENRDAFESQAIPEAIERSIRRLIPYDEILDSYLAPEEDDTQNATGKDDDDSDSDIESDDDDDDDDDEDINVSVPSSHVTHHQAVDHQHVVTPSALQEGAGGVESDDDDIPPPCPPYPSPPSVPSDAQPSPAYAAPPVAHMQQPPPPIIHAPPGTTNLAVAQGHTSSHPQGGVQQQQLFGQDTIRQTL